jgi:hypothetical protein
MLFEIVAGAVRLCLIIVGLGGFSWLKISTSFFFSPVATRVGIFSKKS